MNTKAKGTAGERELIHYFNENGWCAIRAAGSGSSRFPSPDILAGNAIRRLAIECKVTKENKKYFSPEEVDQLKVFSQKFGAEAWIAVKFKLRPWYFLMLEDLENTGACFAASLEQAQTKGLSKEELLQTNS
jgi:Holliday junction resolvase